MSCCEIDGISSDIPGKLTPFLSSIKPPTTTEHFNVFGEILSFTIRAVLPSLIRIFHLNENQIYEFLKAYNHNNKFFNIHVLQKWILFIHLFDKIKIIFFLLLKK